MRKWLSLVLLGGLLAANTGCFINAYDPNPNVRMQQLLFQSEDLRQIREEWRRIWFTNQPSSMTFDRVSGAVGP